MERTLNEPLSASEIKEIILQEISNRLNGDSTLLDDLAYAGFSAKFTINISFLRSLTKPTEVWGATESASIAETEAAGAIDITSSHISVESPDLERQSHNLPIPVMIQTPSGMERRKVKIERPMRSK